MGSIIELNQLVNLVQFAAHSLLPDHLRDDGLSLVRADTQEVSKFFKGNVEVDFWKYTHIVLNQSLV